MNVANTFIKGRKFSVVKRLEKKQNISKKKLYLKFGIIIAYIEITKNMLFYSQYNTSKY